MKNQKSSSLWLLILLFLLALFAAPLNQLHGLAMMPGDIGDARLNNYFLENIYQFFAGRSGSLWHLGFFSPFPYVVGFSDNLFGASPVYLLARLLTGQSDTAYQIWFLIGYAANFAASYYALRRLGGGQLASAVGALIFTFALPTTAHAGHAQLHYRFGIPLAVTFFIFFLDRKEFRLLTIAAAWLVWQFYCGVYMGFFTLLLLAAIAGIHFLRNRYAEKISFLQSLRDFAAQWRIQNRHEKGRALFYLAFLLIAMAVLFYPYLQVTHLYGAKRSWSEIASMLPRPQSYFLSDASYFWSPPASKIFAGLPMRHEHQMFMGIIPILLAIAGFIIGRREKRGRIFVLMSGALVALMALTLYVGGFSFWFLLHKLPLASAIRVMTRLDQVMLFPAAYLAGIAVDYLANNLRWGKLFVVIVVLPLTMIELSATSMNVSGKQEWRDRLLAKEAVVPRQLPENALLFFAQNKGPFFADELDAMWVSLNHGANTLNGYSGIFPPGYSAEFGNDCAELQARVLSFLSFRKDSVDKDAYLGLMKRIVPLNFEGCDPKWLTTSPDITKISREYTADEIRRLHYRFDGKTHIGGKTVVQLAILNSGTLSIAAKSTIGKPMRISWRFLDGSGKPISGWDTRSDLQSDIPARGELNVRLPIDPKTEAKGGALQISLVQETVFWAYDVGLQPLTIPWE